MKAFIASLQLLVSALSAKCMSFFSPYPLPGANEQEVVVRMGEPANRYRDGSQTLLEYPGGHFGQQTFMARMGPDGRMISLEQVRTLEKFGTVKVGQASKDDVLRNVGTPSETSWLPLPQQEVWSYRYRENNVWDSMMHIHFDQDGVVRKIENGRDPLYEG